MTHFEGDAGADSGVKEEESVNYKKPLMFRLADGMASPACMDGSGASAGMPGCVEGTGFVAEGPAADCANGNDDNYCLDGFYVNPSDPAQQCALGANPLTSNGTRCYTGTSPT